MEITKKIPINDLIDKHPDVIPVLMGYGLHCVGCSFAKHDTLETGAKIHGMNEEELEMLVKDVNATIKVSEKDKGKSHKNL
jgi:hybrid cluster-associated redox disulfide protein